jgi:primosomal protein N' (replication factor Y)
VTKLQGAVLEAAGEQWRDAKEVLLAAGAKTTGPVKKLVEAGLLESRRVRVVRSELDLEAQQLAAEGGPPELSEEQSAALERLVPGLGRFGVHLLHGVTGSGKTEVYLRLIAALRERDDLPGGVIVLVPEIALTPQAVGRFYARFGGQPVRVLHSGLTAAQRHAQWRAILADEAPIVIGARSAVFAPVRNLGLIIVDEEHEGSYKQDQLPRYHARDVAVVRARRAPGSCSVGLEASGGRSGPSAAPQGSASGGSGGGVPVVLGSATPSLESYANAVGVGGVPDASSLRSSASASGERPKVEPAAGWHYLRLAKRVPGMRLPEVELVDLAQERRERKGVHLLGRLMEQRLTQCFDSDRQALLLLNRRGFANYIACPDHGCGWMLSCDHCDATMVYHKDARLPTGGVVRCHHCTAERVLPEVCPMSGHRVVTFGLGTQRVEEELGRKFPDARVVRMDSDAMRMGRDFAATLRAFGRREIDVLLGTQMIAKGLDFPGVGLVGVVWADTALNLPDFRSAERTFQLIAQVAGRSGRSERAGRVVVQTFNPDDPAVRLAAEHDYDRFAPRELALRAAAGLPPVWRMARVVLRDPDQIKSVRRARESADLLGGLNKQQGGEVRIVGPSPPALSRVADHFRQQILLLSPPPRAAGRLQDLLTAARNAGLVSDDRTAVDVDPLALL